MCRRDSSVSNVAVLCYLSKVATERSFVLAIYLETTIMVGKCPVEVYYLPALTPMRWGYNLTVLLNLDFAQILLI
jgi:hypothetical protein